MSASARRLAGELLAHALAGAVHALPVELRVGTRDVDELEQAELRRRLREADRAHAARRRSRPSRRARRRGRSARRRCRARPSRSRAPNRPRSGRARAGGSRARSRTPNRCASSISTSENAPASRGSTCSSACSRSRPSERERRRRTRATSSSPMSSLSEVSTPGSMPSSFGELLGVGEVAVVAEREAGVGDRAVHRLRVAPRARTGRGVADVADREMTVERREPALVEHLRDEAHVLDDGDRLAVAHRDAGRLLPAVLQRVEAEVRAGARRAGRVRTRRRRRTRRGAREVRVQGHQYLMSGATGSSGSNVATVRVPGFP